MHQTLSKFGYPNTCLFETEHWSVILRPVQITLGSMVIIYKDSDVFSLSRINPDDFSEFTRICAGIESALFEEFGAKKFNYLALMMMDPHVHFHVLPRYDSAVKFDQCVFYDNEWPNAPNITANANIEPETFVRLKSLLKLRLSNDASI